MSSFLTASIGRKVFMSLTGLFLILFLVVHLTVNLFLTFDDTGKLFNVAAHFMATNPFIRIMEPILALGFIIHIIWSGWITLVNMNARPQGYAVGDKVLSWWAPSKNMFVLGSLVLIFLVIHIMDFWIKMRFTGDPLLDKATGLESGIHNSYALVSYLFINNMVYDVLYIVGSLLLGFHISHGFWSAFQTIGINNIVWMKRLKNISIFFGYVFAIGFAAIPLYFMIKF
jgi:succinate dehydrogenase / fumarate reductase, cytochrome b subunit